ncbi:hypothetical protein B0T11DRAFT_321926 [Plectosphaerella cucumerina]|jgi:hypothetical protein|uniref:Extracellular membrane protein CFEM domain-containing protein n=1 Tax=Plectosphaerella cucumerina TaxID=40658 RepID=A0A8K0T886_9PEZI|nr:hypothetical protein B0T11DRAFT_321926 [Plectosphaerella cucumerina]
MTWSRRKISLLVSCLLLAAPTALATNENDFSLYPGDTQGCLKDASTTSKCGGDTVAEMNKCLCSNGGNFVTNAAKCIGREAPAALRTVWSTMSTSCSDSNTPLAVKEDDFISTGQSESGTPSTRTVTSTAGPSSTSTSSATPTADPEEGPNENTGDANSGGLSVGAKAGIGIGSAAGAAVLGGILAMAWNSRKSRRAHDESRQSMLLDGRGSPGGEAGIGGYHAAAQSDWRAAEKNQGRPESNMTGLASVSDMTADGRGSWMTASSPQQQQQQFKTWGHHPDQPWPVSPPPPPQPLGVVAEAPGVYELSSSEAAGLQPPVNHAVEMPATPGAGTASLYPGPGWTR